MDCGGHAETARFKYSANEESMAKPMPRLLVRNPGSVFHCDSESAVSYYVP